MKAAPIIRSILGVSLFLGVLPWGVAGAPDSGVISGVLDSGGGAATSADYELVGSIDPVFAAPAAVESADYTLYPGFIGQLVNLAPETGSLSAALAEDGTAILDLAGAMMDPDYDVVALSLPGTVSGGSAVLVAGSVRFTPSPTFTGESLVPFRVSDGMLASSGTIRIVDRVPPSISGVLASFTLAADAAGKAVLPDYLSAARILDNSGVLGAASQVPPPGTLVSLGTVNVTLTAADRAGNVASHQILVTVAVPPSITAQPVPVTVTTGSLCFFSVGAAGAAPLSYQWRRNGVPIVGGTSASYTIASVQVAHTGDYDVVVSNAAGSVTSNVAKLSVPSGVNILTQPLAQNASAGAAVTLSVVASGPGPLTYQWRRNGVVLKGATSASYKITSLQIASAGVYDVVVTNPSGSLTSAQAAVALNKAVAITKSPVAMAVNPGAAAGFAVEVSGTQPFTYQWRKGTVAIPGATGASYQIPAVQSGDAGSYSVLVKNAAGSVTSAAAALTLNVPVRISTQPVGGGVNPGASRTLSVVATGTAPLTYQWRRNGTPVPGGTAASYTISPAQEANVGIYDVLVGNVVGSVTSGTATVTLNAAPNILTQTSGLVVNPGRAAVFSVVAGGTAPITYQWRRNGVNLTGATGATYTIASAQAANAGAYDVVVKNSVGSATSASAALGVNTPASTVTQPAGLAVNPGAEAIFKVTAAGTEPLTYQWRRGGVALAGGTGASYAVRAAQAADAGSYDVVVRNAAGSVTSSVAKLTLNVAPAITVQPVGGVLNAGAAKTLSVTATGTAPLGYQWRKNGTPIAGATGTSYALGAVQAASAGTYDVVVSNVAGSVTSAGAVVSVNGALIEAPQITTQPASLAVTTGSSATFTVAAFGGIPLSYQWRKNGVPIVGGTQAALSLPSAGIADAGTYDVVITNSKGTVTSAGATLTVLGPPLAITTQPGGASVNAGGTVSFSVAATGTEPLRYQWRKNGAPIAGGTSDTYPLREAQAPDAGSYDVIVTDVTGSVTSAAAILALNVAPSLDVQPVSTAVNPGAPATLSVAVSGTGPLSYQWRRDGVPIAGGTSASLVLASAQAGDAGLYDVVVTNVAGSVTSTGARLSINAPAGIATQPSPLALNPGGSGVLTVAVTGTGPFEYQWRKNGVPVPGATSATLAISNVQASDAGSYDVVVTNVAGSSTSAAAVVTLNTPVSITTQPQGGALNLGASLALGVTASGTAPLTYQWFKNGAPLAGATSAAFALSGVKATDAGRYTVLVGNVVGSVTSAEAEVSVNVPVKITAQPVALTVSAGTPAVFAVTAEGTGPLSYQWRCNGAPVAGGTAASLEIGAAQASDAGSYDVLVGNAAGRAASSAASLVVNAVANLTGEPSDATVNPGSPASFSVVATGTDPFSYQWRRNGVNLPGATGATLTLPAVQAPDAGTYDVQVSNPSGSVVSRGAVLSLNTPPGIGTQPQGVTVNQGAGWSLSVTATGTAPLTYQWRKGGVPVAGGTGATLAATAAQVADAGSYDVVVGNVAGSVTSLVAVVGVNAAATISQQPQGATVEIYAPLTLRVTTAGTGPFSYQWRRNGVPIPDAVEATYTNPAVGPGDGGSYDVVVTNAVGSVTSAAAPVVVTEVPGKVYPPTIVRQPVRALVQPGAAVNLRVSAAGTGPLAYQWFRNGVALAGAVAETYAVAASGAEHMGIYCVQVSNGGGALLSDKVQVVVAGAPGITKDPASFTEQESGALVRLSAIAKGSLPFNYAWKKDDGTSVASGSLEASPSGVEVPLSVVAGGTTMGSYRLVVWNAFGREESAPATVELALHSTRLLRHGWTVFLDPKVYKPGVNMLVGTFPSKAVTLDDTLIVSFGSVDTHTYEWGYQPLGSTAVKWIAGQNKPYLALQQVPGISLSSAYILQVKITVKKTGGVLTLRFATNTFKAGAGNALSPPLISVDLNDAYVPSGGNGNFGVTLAANGSQYGCLFNWYRQGLLGAPVLVGTNSTGFFSVPMAKNTDDADYFVVVVDALGRTVESKHAHLWVFADGD